MLWMKGNPAYQDEVWEELLNGKIVAMYPRPGINHCLSASNIYYCFKSFISDKIFRSCTKLLKILKKPSTIIEIPH